jgi:hypothetical protein
MNEKRKNIWFDPADGLTLPKNIRFDPADAWRSSKPKCQLPSRGEARSMFQEMPEFVVFFRFGFRQLP